MSLPSVPSAHRARHPARGQPCWHPTDRASLPICSAARCTSSGSRWNRSLATTGTGLHLCTAAPPDTPHETAPECRAGSPPSSCVAGGWRHARRFCINNVRAERTGDLPDAELQPSLRDACSLTPANSSLRSLRSRWLPCSSRISQYACIWANSLPASYAPVNQRHARVRDVPRPCRSQSWFTPVVRIGLPG